MQNKCLIKAVLEPGENCRRQGGLPGFIDQGQHTGLLFQHLSGLRLIPLFLCQPEKTCVFACTQRVVSGASSSGVRLDIRADLTSSSVVILV